MLDPQQIEEIKTLTSKGYKPSRIAKELQIDRATVRKYSMEEGIEEIEPKKRQVPEVHPRVVEAKANAETLQWKIEEEKARQQLEKIRPPEEHPIVARKKAEVESKRLDLDLFKTQKELEALKEAERRKAWEEEQRILREIERAEQVAKDEEKKEKRQRWIKGWQDWALSWGISLPWGVSLPTTLKFQVRDAVAVALQNRSESESDWDIRQLVRETASTITGPFLGELETKRKAEESKRREEEAKRKRAKKIEFINKALGREVDDYIKRNRLDPYVNEEAKKKIREQIYNHLLETLPEEIWYVPDSQVREILDSALKDTKERAREVERKTYLDKIKEIKIKDLLQAGMNRLSYYLLVNSKDLGSVTPKEREEARRYLEKELKEEIEGNETVQEVEKIANEILDDFFFES